MARRPPFYADVAFDAADAEAAIAALQRIRQEVNALGNARVDFVGGATSDWTGRFREEFDEQFAASQRRLATIEEQLRAAIVEIRAGQHLAEAEQAHRIRQRADFEEEERRRIAREQLDARAG